ncbi:pseudouridine-5'-phosphatase [Diabrotica virgifera virgifera]|uniref:pseudouridine 5'-phosphatase n=1 Tax=Diabrotica virgifera virgifera TaxID=50390 RepID=A0A6P7GI10_DIAVI|nr:pseudouridine-5'-phosphatase [Diabrotica virgifera virgifera]
MQFKKVTHVIFDMDGLLIESESIYDEIIGDIARNYGKEYTEECRVKVLGSPELDTAKIVVKELGLPITPEEFLVVYKKRQIKDLAHPPLLPGVRELVKHLYKNEIPIAVATSSSLEAMQVKTKDHQDVFKLFHHIVCGSTDPAVKHGKPAPDIFLVCASRFPDKPSPSKCLVFEDAPNGIRGALSAGMQAVMVPASYISQELRKPATLVLDSLSQFKPELFGLPAIE